jgi:hypothetical protein
MIPLLSLVSLAAGGTLAYTACRLPRRSAALETYGGLLLIGGLVLLGAGLPRLF